MHLLVPRKQSVFRTLLLIFFVCGSVYSHAQPEPFKFGKIEMKDLEMTTYAKDTSASAVVLGDYGNSYYTYMGEDFQVNLERTVRIKILKKSGYQWADAEIILEKSGATEERVTELKGFTYNLENGKIVKSKLEKESIFQEKVNENLDKKKFTMPNVKEGSVIEYTYTVKSEFYWHLPEWEFQREIPVVWSEYRARVPEFFIFKQYSQGYEPYFVNTIVEGRESFAVRYEAEVSGGSPLRGGQQRTPGGIDMVEKKNTTYRWVVKDVPAIIEEQFITTIDDYVTKIEFELTGTKFGDIPKTFRQTWEEMAKSLLESEYFGRQLNRTGFLKDEMEGIKAKYSDPVERTLATYAFVKKTMKWDGKKRLYPETTLKKAYENRAGNSADINMLLVAMLKEEGLDANPVILSTRDNGRAPYYPLLNKYNYVVAHVNLNGKTLLMDATEPLASADMLPYRCLNGEGRLISANPASVELHNNEKFMSYSNVKLTLNPDGMMSGTIEESHGGYNGLSLRKMIVAEGKEKYIETLKKKNVGWELESYELINLEKPAEVFQTSCKVNIGESAQSSANLIYLNPMLHQKEETNPFKLEQRKYPVDFAAPQEETYVLTLILPAGYQVEEMPKPALVSLPDGAGRFMYNVTANGNTIQVISKVTMKKTFFAAEEYAYLKEFYNHIVTKHAEQIVLKKKS